MALSFAEPQLDDTPETTEVQVDLAALVDRLEHDPEFFIQFFMAEELVFPVPEFHITTFNSMIALAVSKFAIAMPRGHGKTTLVKLACVWLFLFSKIRFIAYVSNTSPVAKEYVADIIRFLESENCARVFGKIRWHKRNESEGQYTFELGGRLCILRGLGAGQQIRGINIENRRPDLAIADDIEDDDNTNTEEQRKKLKRWFYGAFMRAVARGGRVIHIGNLIHKQQLLAAHLASQFWHSMRMGAILSDGTSLWPDMFPISFLRQEYREAQEQGEGAKWFAERQNLIVPEGTGLINPTEIDYLAPVSPADCEVTFITIDPAISKKTRANNTGIAIHGLVMGQWVIVETRKAKMDPTQIFDECLPLILKWRVHTIGIESNAYQAALKSFFDFLLAGANIYDCITVPVYAGIRKVDRIVTWASWLKKHIYALTEGDFETTNQLLSYDTSKEDNDDDLIDACAHGPKMITDHLGLIMRSIVSGDRDAQKLLPQVRGSYEICGV